MVRKAILFVLVFFLFLSFHLPAFAAENFTTAYNVTYSVAESGDTHVEMRIGLTNTTSQYYASAYSIQVGFENISSIQASDAAGSVTPKVKKIIEGNVIDVSFNKQTIGLGKTHSFTISFDTPDIAKKQGSIWEINIPGITNQNDFTGFTVAVLVPKSFGDPVYSKPQAVGAKAVFSKEQLGKSGISLAYGDAQVYDFSLSYHLQNPNLFPIKTEIALPPSTNYQDVYIKSISPSPSNVVLDNDGNWLAEYKLKPSEKVDVTTKGWAKLYLYPRVEVQSEKDLAVYLKEQKHWEVSDAEIQRLAKTLKTPRAIYDYVVKTLTYDFTRVTNSQARLGAANALRNTKSAVCLEFTDLFVAIARAAGIPAREVNGFAYTQNARQRPLSLVKDILHAWPEYYDRQQQTWVMIDPTWGNTTGGVDYFTILDFDHFAFVIKGEDSQYPIPAGGYKLVGGEDKRDVDVKFSTREPDDEQKLTVIPDVKREYVSFLPISGVITVKNVGTGITSASLLEIESDTLFPHSQARRFPAIPPYGNATIPFSFDPVPILTNTSANFTIRIQEDIITEQIAISPFYVLHQAFSYKYSYVVFAVIVLIFVIAAGSLLIFRRK